QHVFALPQRLLNSSLPILRLEILSVPMLDGTNQMHLTEPGFDCLRRQASRRGHGDAKSTEETVQKTAFRRSVALEQARPSPDFVPKVDEMGVGHLRFQRF